MWLNVCGGVAKNDSQRTIDGLPVIRFPVALQELVNTFHGSLGAPAWHRPEGFVLFSVHIF